MQGWIQLHRELMEKAIWRDSTPEQKTIFVTLLMMANHKENEWEWKSKKFKVKPGQFITSTLQISKNCGKSVTEQKVRTAIKRFERYGFLTDESSNTGRLITIVNWGSYQSTTKQINNHKNEEVTGTSLDDNGQITPNKKDKNLKNVLKDDEDASMNPILDLLVKRNFIDHNRITFTLREDLKEVSDHFGFDYPNEMIIEAIKDTERSGGKSWKYIYNKLVSWRNKQITNLADLNSTLSPNSKNQKESEKIKKVKALLDKY